MRDIYARACVSRRFPDCDPLGLTKMGEGWDNVIYKAQGTAFRVPKRKSLNARAESEFRLLSMLRQRSLAVPQVISIHRADAGCPYTVYSYIPVEGTPLSSLEQSEWNTGIISGLADFLRSLHSTSQDVASTAGLPAFAGRSWRSHYARLRSRLRHKAFPLLREAALHLDEIFESYLNDEANFRFRPSLIHGDLALEHVLVDRGQISGIIDFGDARVGDPALDFAGMPAEMAEAVIPLYLDANHSHKAKRILSRSRFYKAIAPCYALLHAAQAGSAEAQVALARLSQMGGNK